MAIRWTNRKIDRALAELSRAYASTPEESLVFATRVRREAEARFGVDSWHARILADAYGYTRLPAVGLAKAGITERITDEKVDVHTAPVPVFGMLEGLRVFFTRPAFALATMVVVVAGVLAYRQSTDSTLADRPRDPQTSSAVAVAPAAPFGEGTGFAVSVFGESLAVAPSTVIAPTAAPVRTGVRRARPLPLNPAPGVFSQWGTSVFSDDEALTRPWEGGKSIFSS